MSADEMVRLESFQRRSAARQASRQPQPEAISPQNRLRRALATAALVGAGVAMTAVAINVGSAGPEGDARLSPEQSRVYGLDPQAARAINHPNVEANGHVDYIADSGDGR